MTLFLHGDFVGQIDARFVVIVEVYVELSDNCVTAKGGISEVASSHCEFTAFIGCSDSRFT